jgi:hypothetical protein
MRHLVRDEEDERRFLAGDIPGVCFAHVNLWVSACLLHGRVKLCILNDKRIPTIEGEDLTDQLQPEVLK